MKALLAGRLPADLLRLFKVVWISGETQWDGLDVVARETDVWTAASLLCCKVRMRIVSCCEMIKENHVCIFIPKLVLVALRT